MARVRIRLEMRGWSVMVVLLGIGGRTNRMDELPTCIEITGFDDYGYSGSISEPA